MGDLIGERSDTRVVGGADVGEVQVNLSAAYTRLIRFAFYGQLDLVASAVVVGAFLVCFALATLGYDPQRGLMGRVQRPA